MNPAPNLVLVGPMGAGKTSIGRRLAERFGLTFVDVDRAIVEHCGASVPAIFENLGEAGFRQHERAVLARVLAGGGQLVATGGGAVLDPDNRALMRARGYVVHLDAGVATQLQRVAGDRNRPLLLQGDRRLVLERLAGIRQPLYREVADHVLCVDGLSPGQATGALVLHLAHHWQREEAVPS
ncbi:MAG: shikimate kinase [Pseudoxanthomonas sp.]